MSTGNSIQGSVGFDLAPMKRDLAEAERSAKAAGAKIERAIAASTTGGATRRVGPPLPFGVDFAEQSRLERRRRNSAAGFAPARPGQYPSPDESDSPGRRRRGGVLNTGMYTGASMLRSLIGLSGAGAIGAMFMDAAESAAKLRQEIASITKLTGPGAFRGTGEIESNLSAAAAKIQEINKQQAFDRSNPFRQAVAKVRDAATGENDETREQLKSELRRKAASEIDALAQKQSALNSVRAKQQMGSERQAALDEEEIEHRERIGKLAAAEAATGVNNPAAIRAEQSRSILARSDINRRFNSEGRQRTAEAEQQGITEAASRGAITPRAASMARLRARQRLASSRAMEGGISEEEKAKRQAESRSANLDVFNEAFEQSESMSGQTGVETRRAERLSQRRRSAFFGRNQDAADRKARGARDEIALGDAPRSGKDKGDYNNGPSESFKTLEPLVKDLVTELQKLNAP